MFIRQFCVCRLTLQYTEPLKSLPNVYNMPAFEILMYYSYISAIYSNAFEKISVLFIIPKPVLFSSHFLLEGAQFKR